MLCRVHEADAQATGNLLSEGCEYESARVYILHQQWTYSELRTSDQTNHYALYRTENVDELLFDKFPERRIYYSYQNKVPSAYYLNIGNVKKPMFYHIHLSDNVDHFVNTKNDD